MTGEQILRQFEDALKITEWNKEAKKILSNIRGIICCDTETTGLLFHTPSYFKDEERWVDNPFPFGISLAFNYNGRIVLVWGRKGCKLYDVCKSILASPNIKCWHNMKYDRRVCKTNGIEVKGPQHCTLTMSRIYWDRRKDHRLQALSEFLCPQISAWEEELKEIKKREKAKWTRTVKKEKIWLPEGMDAKDYWNYSFLPDEIIGAYSMCDVFVDYIIYEKVAPIISSEFRDLYVRERKIVNICMDIEERGMTFDWEKAEKLTKPLVKEQEKCMKTLIKLGCPDFTLYHQKIQQSLINLGIKKEQLIEKGKVTTGADILDRCLKQEIPKKAREFIDALKLYRAYNKTTNTYLIPFARQAKRNNGVIYTTINPSDTRTSRMASRDPNLQNIPTLNPRRGRTAGGENPVRSCFICRSGFANYYFDYEQMEIAFFGLYANEPLIVDTYLAGGDIHGKMAETLYGKEYTKIERDKTKDTNYGIIYGMGADGMAKYRGVPKSEARKFLQFYRDTFPSISMFLNECKDRLKTDGYVEDGFGRKYHVNMNDAYKAINVIVQGGCAQVVKIAIENLCKHHEELTSYLTHMLMLEHDEIIYESQVWKDIRAEKEFMKRVIYWMTEIPQLFDRGLKLRVDVKKTDTNWAEKAEVKI